ncbi:MAG: ATP-dependent protease LonB [Candidatus Methanofastidiosia archaeon]
MSLKVEEVLDDNDLGIEFKTTEEIEIPKLLVDQVIGQEHGVELIKVAAKQRRNVLLVGEPGNGKSMLGQAMAELLPMEDLEDLMAYPNHEDPHTPRIRRVPAGEAKPIVERHRVQARKQENSKNFIILLIGIIILVLIFYSGWNPTTILMGMFVFFIVFFGMQSMRVKSQVLVPKLLVDNSNRTAAPFVDATGAHAGALLGDVRHDPFQSGGLGTPAHERVEAGMIQKANKGVLFIDEIATLGMKMQQAILTAMQERRYSITGQSEMSSGAMVRTEPAPCDFILVAAGNMETIRQMHPALRSRIRGYGYEVYMNDTMPDNIENRKKLVQFVAQEVVKDGRIPHFTKDAVLEILKESKRRAGRKGHLSTVFRDLGGVVRSAGDVAIKRGKKYVDAKDVLDSKKMAKSLEHQISDKYIEKYKDYSVIKIKGQRIGRINALAVIGGTSGIVHVIEAEVAPSASKEEGKVIATGKLGEIAKEAVQNISALIKKYTGTDISNYDIHVQYLQSYEGVEGDSASVTMATAVISALERIPIKQDIAMTGSLSVRGEVLPIGGVNLKIEAAIEAGLKKVIIPYDNLKDINLDKRYEGKIEVVPVKRLDDVLDVALMGERKSGFLEKIKKYMPPLEIEPVGNVPS